MKAIKFYLTALATLILLEGVTAAQRLASNPCDKQGTYFQIDDPMSRNTVTFTSTAPLEDIVGTSSDITGYVSFDPMHPSKGGHGEIRISVASLNTGIPLRDEHLRGEDWLDAGEFSYVTLRINRTSGWEQVKSGDGFTTWNVTIEGTLSLHGESRKVQIPGRLTFLKESEQTRQLRPGNLLAARASFAIALANFGITGPEGMGIIGSKVGKMINVEVSFRASDASGTRAHNPCGGKAKALNPCGDKAAMNPGGGKAAMNPCADKAMNPCGGK